MAQLGKNGNGSSPTADAVLRSTMRRFGLIAIAA
jgi:hypothetical protein